MARKPSLVGARFGRLTVIESLPSKAKPCGQKVSMYRCKCDCGNETTTCGGSLRSKVTKSCGCLRLESQRTHGLTRHALYQVWKGMIARCYNKDHVNYARYGGRGIRVCKRWNSSPELFVLDIPPRPSKLHTLDRIKNDGNYEPGNVKWSTAIEQSSNRANNRNATISGKTLSANQWSRIVKVSSTSIYYFCDKHNASVEDAVRFYATRNNIPLDFSETEETAA